MPQQKSAKKALRQNKKRALRNKNIKGNLQYLQKQVHKAIEQKNLNKAKEWAVKFIKETDKAAQKKIIKKNTAARRKSRMMKKMNKIKS